MKYFSPSYWLKLWVLSAPFFNDKTQGINAKSIDSKQNIKDWASENTTGISVLEQQELNFSNSTEFINYQTQLDSISNQELEINTHKHRHEKNRNRHKRQPRRNWNTNILQLNNKLIIDMSDSRQYITTPW